MKYAKQRDANETCIVLALEAAGYAVAKVGDTGAPDLLVSKSNEVWLIEVKRPLGKRGGKHHHGHGGVEDLTAAQVRWHASWHAAGGKPVAVVRTADEALAAVGHRIGEESPHV